MKQIVECIMNVSEGKDLRHLEAIAHAIASTPETYMLGFASDLDHHRTVFSFVSSPEKISEAAFAAFRQAVEKIDLNIHRGVHPRMGAVDVVPFVPIEGVTLDDCVQIARRLGRQVGEDLEVPVYLYEAAATTPRRRLLAEVRRGQFEALKKEDLNHPERRPDFGPPRLHPTAGATAIGARGPLIAFNVYLRTSEMEPAQEIARRIRESSGGLPAVRALGFFIASRGQSQVSMNLVDFRRTSIIEAFQAVEREAARLGIAVDCGEIIGLVPREALNSKIARQIRLQDFDPDQLLEARIEKMIRQTSN